MYTFQNFKKCLWLDERNHIHLPICLCLKSWLLTIRFNTGYHRINWSWNISIFTLELKSSEFATFSCWLISSIDQPLQLKSLFSFLGKELKALDSCRSVIFCKDICLIYIAHTWLTAHLYRIEIANICMNLTPSFMSRFIAKYLYMDSQSVCIYNHNRCQ